MRALCGAIITAGALIGLGITALGYGIRYERIATIDKIYLWQMDTPLVFSLIFLTVFAIIGLGLAFLGLAYHHHRRHHEVLRQNGTMGTRTSV